MTGLISAEKLTTVRVNGQAIPVEPKETVLQAALRAGIDFPNSCRVGGCGTCRCKLASGRVKELTETGYLLTSEEIDQGFILACQSVPRGDVSVEVDLSRASARGVAGRIVGQTKVTQDIVRLTVQLDQMLPYKAGQFANLAIDGLPGVVRSYSFATPSHRDARVTFYVRKVPGGEVSSLLVDTDVVGRGVRVDGPVGDFFLRASDAPLFFVAGGSGLAPILAILKDAAASGMTRPATLLFGARTQADLYALDEIAAIAKQWKGEFRFVPVLSAAEDDATWTGARGLVTEKIPELLPKGAHGYLCGPPAMIDGAIELLRREGVSREHIHFDRFTTRADAALEKTEAPAAELTQERSTAGVFHYLKYFAFHFIGLLAASAIFGGGNVATSGLITVLVLYMLGDAVLGDDTSTPHFTYPKILTTQLWLALPLLSVIVFAAVWSVSPGDPLGAGALIHQVFGWDALAHRAMTGLGGHISIFVLTGLMIGMIGTITAHELTHRTWDPVSMFIGRWLLAFSFDTTFAIEHVYGHHRYVSTEEDPATAPRGRNVYHHIVASTIKGNVSAWKIETDRLRKKRLPVWSFHNAMIRGELMSAALVAAAFALGGAPGGAFFVACALWGKSLLEIVNYMEHYGMVRNPATPVQPRHSWNTNRRVSSWTMFNLTRHSHHHAQGEVPYQDLKPYADAPMMVNGYLTTIVIAMIPPLWHKLMTPKVLAWDRDYATGEELELAARANQKSGMRGFAAATSAAAT
ncbi:MAG TPA: fatty acid desaturase [Polyangiaceae bacterium]|nr:fatty acid desaturase [Polyangiaceae bacterium]